MRRVPTRSPRAAARARGRARPAGSPLPLGLAIGEELSTFAEQALETTEVELLGLEREQVPMPPRLQMPVTERLAELRDVDVDAVEGARGRVVVPERVDQAVGRDDLAGAQEKHGEQRPLLAGADLERLSALRDLEWAENAELQRIRHGWARGLILRASQARHKRRSRVAQARRPRLEAWSFWQRTGVSVARGIRWFVVLALLLCVAPSSGHAETPPPDPSQERPSTVVVSVSDDGFQWTDAGVGAAAALATTLLALGLVLALRPHRGENGNS